MPDNYVPITHTNKHLATSFFASSLTSQTETQKDATKVKINLTIRKFKICNILIVHCLRY